MFKRKKQLKKIVKIDGIQVCTYGDTVVLFKKLHNVWEQYVPIHNRPECSHPDDRPLFYYMDDWLDLADRETEVKQLKRGIYTIKD